MNPFKYLVSALLIVPAVYLLAFGPSSNPPGPRGRVVVDYWEKWTSDEEAAMRIIVNQYNATQGAEKNIFIRYVSTSAVNQKTLVATAAGVPPDIAGLWDTNLAQFAQLDAIQPLDDLAAQYGITAAIYKPIYWEGCHYKGHLYALISTPAAVALHYNKDSFIAAGLDPDHPPTTIAELDHDSQLIEKHDASGRLTQSGFLPTEPGWYVNFSYLWFGASIWDDARQKFTLTDPRVIDSFKWIQSYSKRLGTDSINGFHGAAGNFDSPQNPFLSGTLAMTQQGPWMAFHIINYMPSLDGLAPGEADDLTQPVAVRRARARWAAAPFPTSVPGLNNVTYCSFDTLTIPRGARHPKEAFDFIAYVNQQKVMEKLCKLHCKNSPLAKVSDDFKYHHRNAYIQVFEDLANSRNARIVPQNPIFPEVDAEITVLVQKLALLDEEPEPALQELQDRMQKRYDSFIDKQKIRQQISSSH